MEKMPRTPRQKKFFRYVMTAKSFAEAARLAGYSPKSARVSACKNITRYNDFFINFFQEAEIDVDTLAANFKKGMQADDESVRFRYTKLALDLVEKVLLTEDKEVLRTPKFEYDDELSEEEKRDLDEALKELEIE